VRAKRAPPPPSSPPRRPRRSWPASTSPTSTCARPSPAWSSRSPRAWARCGAGRAGAGPVLHPGALPGDLADAGGRGGPAARRQGQGPRPLQRRLHRRGHGGGGAGRGGPDDHPRPGGDRRPQRRRALRGRRLRPRRAAPRRRARRLPRPLQRPGAARGGLRRHRRRRRRAGPLAVGAAAGRGGRLGDRRPRPARARRRRRRRRRRRLVRGPGQDRGRPAGRLAEGALLAGRRGEAGR
jgi:hypothetical protein